jgi:uncharacterized membrane protein YgdD (TMEM256/DUF423 family)
VERKLLFASGVAGALGVLFGAFGAHGLRNYLAQFADGPERRAFWETAAQYHLIHALAIFGAAYLVGKSDGTGLAVYAGWCFALGILLFSGSLYLMTLTGVRTLGAVTPLGGLLFIAGWVLVALAAWKLP